MIHPSPAAPDTREPGTASSRIASIDVVRGLIMILMALDHTRDYFGVRADPTDLATTTAPLFFTRWITHFCAPGFFLLMGTGAFLAGRRSGRSTRQLSWFLFTRGVWLIVLELTFMRCVGYQFNVDYQVTVLIVLWALGWALIGLAALVWLPTGVITTIGCLMIAGHNLLDGIQSTSPLWTFLHVPGFVWNEPGRIVLIGYPVIPWIGVTAAGYGLGQLFLLSPERRKRLLGWMGGACITAFLVLRGLNLYGDPVAWSAEGSPLMTILSFLNATKYPPSLLFLLMTVGPIFLCLRALDDGIPRLLRPAHLFGRVPFFYYVIHFPLAHALAALVCWVRYGSAGWMFQSPDLASYPFTLPPGWGYSLPVVYGAWLLVVLLMYPLCRWYAARKAAHRGVWWYSYL